MDCFASGHFSSHGFLHSECEVDSKTGRTRWLFQLDQHSGAAKRLMHHLVRARRLGVADEAGLILIRRRQYGEQDLEWPEITVVLCCGDRLLDQMIARNERRVRLEAIQACA